MKIVAVLDTGREVELMEGTPEAAARVVDGICGGHNRWIGLVDADSRETRLIPCARIMEVRVQAGPGEDAYVYTEEVDPARDAGGWFPAAARAGADRGGRQI